VVPVVLQVQVEQLAEHLLLHIHPQLSHQMVEELALDPMM
jgi:hypothetical protein